ncbi:MAG TPA: DM13 domain-containing protein [Pyrinomonadaceae bacterium]|nr:DM13 domain-containing protein [Pyrinomonadaceae bacterium]
MQKSLVAALVLTTLVSAGYLSSADAPRVLASGRFHQVAHKGEGTATVYLLRDGRRVLRLTNFRTTHRPDLLLYLISAKDAPENETVKRSEVFSLGPLRSHEGDQEYLVPADLDLARFQAVTVWSPKYGVNFTTAPLKRP